MFSSPVARTNINITWLVPRVIYVGLIGKLVGKNPALHCNVDCYVSSEDSPLPAYEKRVIFVGIIAEIV